MLAPLWTFEKKDLTLNLTIFQNVWWVYLTRRHRTKWALKKSGQHLILLLRGALFALATDGTFSLLISGSGGADGGGSGVWGVVDDDVGDVLYIFWQLFLAWGRPCCRSTLHALRQCQFPPFFDISKTPCTVPQAFCNIYYTGTHGNMSTNR